MPEPGKPTVTRRPRRANVACRPRVPIEVEIPDRDRSMKSLSRAGGVDETASPKGASALGGH